MNKKLTTTIRILSLTLTTSALGLHQNAIAGSKPKPVLKPIAPVSAPLDTGSSNNTSATAADTGSSDAAPPVAPERKPKYNYQPYQPSFNQFPNYPSVPPQSQPSYGTGAPGGYTQPQQSYQSGGYQQPYQGGYQQQQQPYQGAYQQPQQVYGRPPAQGNAYGGYPNYQQQPPQQNQIPTNPAFDQLIPEFGKPLPQVPQSMMSPMPQGPGFSSGYAPAQQQPPYQQNGTQNQPMSVDEQRVTRLEKTEFGTTYPEHDVDDRLEHLEKEVFGKVSSGDTQSRLANLESKLGGQGAFGQSPGMQQQPVMQQPNMAYQPSPPRQQPAPQQQYAPPSYSAPPQPSYGAPPQSSYVAPSQSSYGAPSQPSYGSPPQQSYGAPSQPVYMPPVQKAGSPGNSAPPRQPMAPSQPPVSYVPPMQSMTPPPTTVPGDHIMQPEQPESSFSSSDNNDRAESDFMTAVQSIPADKKAGDYLMSLQHFPAGAYAHWTSFPIRIHLPMNSPDAWKGALEKAIRQWGKAIPTMATKPEESADIEIGWINHLPPKQLGITNLEIFNGHMRVTIYLLRPTYYPPEVSEKALEVVSLHEIGHALGLFGHSTTQGDAMQSLDSWSCARLKSGTGSVSQRDLNTLKKVYEAPGLPSGYQSAQPLSWPFRLPATPKP